MTVKKRSLVAGMTDYTGVPFDTILAHLRDWKDETGRCLETLRQLRGDAEKHRAQLDAPDDVIAYINLMIDLFTRYLCDFESLVAELPYSVTEAHIEIIRQINASASAEETHCIRFKRNNIERQLKDESLRTLLDKIYRNSKSMMIDYQDLSNLVPRLSTFVGRPTHAPPSICDLDILELKPNVFGLGVNLNHMLKRIGEWWSQRRK